MENLTKFPQMQKEIVEDVYQAATTLPLTFVTGTIANLAEMSPALATSRVIDALRISHHQGNLDALNALRTTLFIPACLDRLMRDTRLPSVRVAKVTLDHVASSPQYDQQELENRIRQYSGELAEHLAKTETLNLAEGLSSDVLAATHTKAIKAFEVYERQLQEDNSLDPEADLGVLPDPKPAAVLGVRKSTVLKGLLAIALTPERFIETTAATTKDASTPLDSYTRLLVISASSVHHGNSRNTALTCSFINYCISQEYSLRGLTTPWPTWDSIHAVSQGNMETLNQGLERDSNLSAKFMEDSNSFYDALKKGNPHFRYGLELLQDVSHFTKEATLIPVYHVFRAWTNRASAQYWEELGKRDIPEPEYHSK